MFVVKDLHHQVTEPVRVVEFAGVDEVFPKSQFSCAGMVSNQDGLGSTAICESVHITNF